jgi:hypothetical protein
MPVIVRNYYHCEKSFLMYVFLDAGRIRLLELLCATLLGGMCPSILPWPLRNTLFLSMKRILRDWHIAEHCHRLSLSSRIIPWIMEIWKCALYLLQLKLRTAAFWRVKLS